MFVPIPRNNEKEDGKYMGLGVAFIALVAVGVVWTVTVSVTTGLSFDLADLLFSEAQHRPAVNP